MVDEGVAEGLQLGDTFVVGCWGCARSHFSVCWKRSTLPQVVGWFGLECFSITPRRRSSAWKPLMVLRPPRPPEKRVVNTMPLSESTEAGMPWSATACRNIATTTGPVTGWWQVTERA